MSKSSIPPGVKQELWFNAHGRCAICNKPLYRDGLTMQKVNLSEYAHIIADSPNGPRGDAELSPELAKDPNNLILLCKDHHKMIDDAGGVKKYGVDLLRHIKKAHEDRIEYVTGISPEKKSLVVCYAPKIGDRIPSITASVTTETLFPDMYPMTLEPIRLDATNLPYNDNEQKYWEFHPDILRDNFKQKLQGKLADVPHISLFALAPQPLLILLGTLLGDLYRVEILQKHRDPDTWKWLDKVVKNEFNVIEPEAKEKAPVLIIALSGSDIIERVKNQFGDEYSYWVVTCEQPNRDMMRTREQLSEFRNMMRIVINDINTSAVGKTLKVMPAMPLSCAIAFGHIRLHKSDLPWELFDLPQGSDEYVKTITIE